MHTYGQELVYVIRISFYFHCKYRGDPGGSPFTVQNVDFLAKNVISLQFYIKSTHLIENNQIPHKVIQELPLHLRSPFSATECLVHFVKFRLLSGPQLLKRPIRHGITKYKRPLSSSWGAAIYGRLQ